MDNLAPPTSEDIEVVRHGTKHEYASYIMADADASRRFVTRSVCLWLILLGAFVTVRPVMAQTMEISGYVFGDYYWVASGHDEGANGLWFRRIYLTLDQELDPSWALRLRGEMNQPGDFKTSAPMQPYVKDAYVRWKRAGHQVFLGLSPTPTFNLIESIWGYRSVEKTPLDFYKFGSSRDVGIAAMGSLYGNGDIRYHAMLANGTGTGSEIDRGKMAMLALAVTPVPAFTAEVYFDYDDRRGDTDRRTLQIAAFYKQDAGRVGVQFSRLYVQHPNQDDDQFDVFSAFGALRLTKTVNAFARFDRQFQPNPFGDRIAYCPFATTNSANLLIGGLDIGLHDAIRLQPNVEVVFYDEESGVETPEIDVMPRMTFYVEF